MSDPSSSNAGPLQQQRTFPLQLDQARRELRDEILRGHGGRAALARFSDRLDAMVRQMFVAGPRTQQQIAVVAIGGYGRRQLCLHSDIDLLVLFGGHLGVDEESALRAILHPLWDLGLVVGHQVREIDEFDRLEVDNPEFLMALVDARPVAGDRALYDRFESAFHHAGTHAHVVSALNALIDERYNLFNSTLYQLEPDIKESPGALRDLTATRWIAALTDPSLLRRGVEDPSKIEEAEEFLLRVRSILHLESKRNQNQLTHQLQEIAADILGYPGAFAQQRVERLMSDYFRHARIVTRSLAWMRKAAPTPAGLNLGRTGDGIRFIDMRQAAIQPATWLAAFQAAIDHNCPVSDSALSLIRQYAERFRVEDFFPTPAHRAGLLRFLRPAAGLYARLSEMHDCGVLGRMFPPFQAITYRVVRDFFHKYTVDEHTLLTIRNLERLVTQTAVDRERYCSLIQDLQEPELLVLSLLLHDVGKWRDDDHHVESVRMAREMFGRIGLAQEARDTVEFLIANHLAMSQVAFRRDTEDPEIVRRFAELVGVEERLKMLCLMTLADVEAVSTETMTPWRAELLWRLYVDTYNHLTLGYGDERIEANQPGNTGLIAGRPSDLTDKDVRNFLEGLPRRYLRLFDNDAIYRHVRLARDIHPDEVHLWMEQEGASWELTVVTLDKPFLFSNISGVLASFGMDILRGHAMTSSNGLVLDVFQFADSERLLELNDGARELVFSALNDVVSGKASVTERLRGRQHSLFNRRPMRITPVVHADNTSSKRYTIIDIIADDELGLLYRISRVMSQNGCDVDLVLISTEGRRAIDVFHITKAGRKLSTGEQTELSAHLQRVLEGGYEAT
ncbi:MAG TPA: HD domain-containing protein [Vicinamibacterales bacterium]|nr:HD domain-containing protein [Vicinamibacterales bacterium]